MNNVQRPVASNYNALNNSRKTLSAKADSVFSYRNVNPYSVAYDQFKRSQNENLDDALWQQASNKGELDQYINLLLQNPKKSSKLTELQDTYGERVDYDTAMLALSYDAVADDVKEDRYDSSGNLIGNFTQRELIDKVLSNQAQRWEAEITDDAEKSKTFWQKVGSIPKAVIGEIAAFDSDIIAGLTRSISESGNTLASALYTLKEFTTGRVKTFDDIARAYTFSASNQMINDPQLNVGGTKSNALAEITKINDDITKFAYDIRKNWSYSIDPTTGEYTKWGKALHGMADSIGYMTVSMFGGGPAAMYLPMFTSNIIENSRLSGYNTDYSKLFTNATIKTGVEYYIEKLLGKVIGFSTQDILMKIGKNTAKATAQAVAKGVTATTKEAAGMFAKTMLKDMAKEGLEEVLQDMSGMAIDYLYGDEYSARGKEAASLENLAQAFIVGAATSLVIGSFTTMVTRRETGVDESGMTYKMGAFQSVAYKQSLKSLAEWRMTANDAKADPNDRLDAAMKLESVVATLGTLYESLGVENAVKAEKLLQKIQQYHDKKESIKDQVSKGTYVKNLISGITSEFDGQYEVGSSSWTKAFEDVNRHSGALLNDMQRADKQRRDAKDKKTPVAYESFRKALQNKITEAKLAASGATKVDKPIDLTGETANVDITLDSLLDIARKLGFNIAARTDGKDIIVSDDVIFLPESMLDTDTQALLREVAAQKTIENVITNIPAELLISITSTYSKMLAKTTAKYTEAEVANMAIAALMFDKNFQLKMLLEVNKNDNSWGTKQVINFIKNLKKMVAKTYTTSATEKTASGKAKRILTQASKTVSDRVINSLQESVTMFNLTVKSQVTYDVLKDKVNVDKTLSEVLTTENIKNIEDSVAVKYGAILESIKNNIIPITPTVKTFIHNIAEDILNDPSLENYLKTIKRTNNIPVDNIISTEALETILLKILSKGSHNERTDLVASITVAFRSDIGKNKLQLIPVNDPSSPYYEDGIKLIADIEKSLFGGQSIKTVLDARFDLAALDESLLNSIPEDFAWNDTTRFIVLNDLIKNKSNNKFAITQAGTLVLLNHDLSNLVDNVANAKTTVDLLRELNKIKFAKKDKLLRLQDVYKINIGPIGNIVIGITNGLISSGYYRQNANLIMLQLNQYDEAEESLSILFHEMIHAVNDIDADERLAYISGNAISLSEQTNPDSNDLITASHSAELEKYIRETFPLTSSLAGNDSTLFLGKALYYLLYDENTARSVYQLYPYSSVGFKAELDGNNTLNLVSLDGKISLPVYKTVLPEIAVKFETMQLLLSFKANDATLLDNADEAMNYILQGTTVDEYKKLALEVTTPMLEDGLNTRHYYSSLHDLILANLDDNFPNLDLSKIKAIIKEAPNNKRTNENRLQHLRYTEPANIVLGRLAELAEEVTDILSELNNLKLRSYLPNNRELLEAVNFAYTDFAELIVIPIRQELLAREILNIVTSTIHDTVVNLEPSEFKKPTTFNFGEYSLVKHTGRSYMLTKQTGNGRYITQEVAMDTLLPIRPNQQPLIADKQQRDKMLFVIAKKIEVAEKLAKEPKLPEPEKKAKPIEKKTDKVVFQWGGWLVKEFDATHYTVSKDIDKTNDTSDETGDESRYTAVQVVSKKTLLPDTMLGATGKPILSASERSNILDWIAHETGPQLLKVEAKENPDDIRWIYRPNLSDKAAEPMTKEAIEDFEESELADDVPGNVSPYYELGSRWVTKMAEFYQKYPSLRAWVEGIVDKTPENLKAFIESKDEAINLLYGELYKTHFGIKNDYQKSANELKKQVNDFLKTPIYFVRTQSTKTVDGKQPINSVSLGYDLNTLPIFGNKGDFVFYGSILPTDLVGFLPNSYAEGILTSSRFGINAPIKYSGTEKELRTALKTKLATNENPSDKPMIDEYEYQAPSPRRKYISNDRAKKSNLRYFIRKGRPIQMHSDVAAFVESTTADFDQLSKYFQVRIKKGKLTRHDISNYIATTKSINAFTWKAIAKYIYHNTLLADIGPSMAKFFLDKDLLETYAYIARLAEDEAVLNKVNTIADFKKLDTEFKAKLRTNNIAFIKKYEQVKKALDAWWYYDQEGKLTRDEYIIDEKQLLPIFMAHFDGTLKSLNTIFTLAKVLAGKQTLQTVRDNTSSNENDANANKTTKISSGNAAVENNAVAKNKNSRYNWLDYFKQNVIDYEITGYDPDSETDPELQDDNKTFDDLSDEDKFNYLYNYLFEKSLEYITKRTEQDEYEADKEVLELIKNMSDEEIDKAVRFILDDARGSASIPTNEAMKEYVGELKIARDNLRNRARRLIQSLAGSKVEYNKLPDDVKALIEFTPTSSRVLAEAYAGLALDDIAALSAKVAAEIKRLKVAQQQARDLEKTKSTIARKVQALHNKELALAEKDARLKARAQKLKDGANLRAKINVTYDTKIDKQTFTITGPSQINPKLEAILNHTWNKQANSKVKYMDDSVQTMQNVHIASEFYKEHAGELSAMTLSEIEDITDWLIQAHINTSDSVAKQTFEATQFFILAYIYNETGTGIFVNMNANLKLKLGNYLKAIQTSAGTLLSLIQQVKKKLNPTSIITVELFSRFEIVLTAEQEERIDKAFIKGDTEFLTKTLSDIKAEVLKTLTPEKVSSLRKVAAIRGMSMVSGPMTWIRNITSNYVVSGLNRVSTKIANAFLPEMTGKNVNTPQFKLTSKVTKEVQDFITKEFIESGFFDETLDQMSKYNPSQILRHKRAGEQDIIRDMLNHSIYNHFYSESMFESKMLNHIHTFLMKRLSDKNFVRAAAVRYLGKLLAETGHHLDANGNIKTSIDKEIMTDVANAFALATTDYMHSDNFFSHVEQWLSQHSTGFWAAYKTIMPFATASWNWFKAAMRYSPVGLGQAIVRLTRLEQEIIKREAAWTKGDSQIAPELTTYLIKRDLGSGIIGTIAFGFGAILAALGYISLEDDDWGTPKLMIGNLRIDVSTIFGSSSALAGAAFIKTLQNKDLTSALDAMLDPLVDGFFFTELLQMDANSPKGWFEWGKYQAQSIVLSFIPSMVRYISGMTYTGTYRANSTFQKAVVRLPFLGQAFDIPKRTNVYTGDTDGTFWDIVHRAIPYFEIVTKSMAQEQTEMYGLNKEELNGTYKINGESFSTDPKETARINKLYGMLNADALTDFYANEASYRVLTANKTYATKRYSQMTPEEISNALDQIFSYNSSIAKVSAWLEADHSYYTNDQKLYNTLRKLGYTKVYLGNKGFVK